MKSRVPYLGRFTSIEFEWTCFLDAEVPRKRIQLFTRPASLLLIGFFYCFFRSFVGRFSPPFKCLENEAHFKHSTKTWSNFSCIFEFSEIRAPVEVVFCDQWLINGLQFLPPSFTRPRVVETTCEKSEWGVHSMSQRMNDQVCHVLGSHSFN